MTVAAAASGASVTTGVDAALAVMTAVASVSVDVTREASAVVTRAVAGASGIATADSAVAASVLQPHWTRTVPFARPVTGRERIE